LLGLSFRSLCVRADQRVALLTLASSQRDAEAINIAGSLRMQSYRLGYEMQRNSPSLAAP
jgi:two-component system nitrate/nitrite sensor histidine kinase NarQ